MKRYTSSKAICPLYRHENRQVIFCEGVVDGTVLHLAFANASDCLSYKKQYCRCNYALCPISKMLMPNYNNIK